METELYQGTGATTVLQPTVVAIQAAHQEYELFETTSLHILTVELGLLYLLSKYDV